jgi:3,4-dihydroxy 2-butanone 4-phosphate synthase/GTP cyclohydrolase II
LFGRFKEGGVICEIMNEDGSMSRLPDLHAFAQKHDMKIVSIEDLIHYQLKKEILLKELKKEK